MLCGMVCCWVSHREEESYALDALLYVVAGTVGWLRGVGAKESFDASPNCERGIPACRHSFGDAIVEIIVFAEWNWTKVRFCPSRANSSYIAKWSERLRAIRIEYTHRASNHKVGRIPTRDRKGGAVIANAFLPGRRATAVPGLLETSAIRLPPWDEVYQIRIDCLLDIVVKDMICRDIVRKIDGGRPRRDEVVKAWIRVWNASSGVRLACTVGIRNLAASPVFPRTHAECGHLPPRERVVGAVRTGGTPACNP